MRVIATAGHVDHGKSTLMRALTGIETDRWAEEKRRGLTIDLGFAWTALPGGTEVSFVDVPGHERFIGNMLAGLGPAPVVLFVVAADEGWQQQSSDHRDAVLALGIDRGVIALTRSDLAQKTDPSGAALRRTEAQVREQLAGTGLAGAPVVPVSAVTGEGIPALQAALEQTLSELPPVEADAPVRLWVDRSFTISGAGTVITGTLSTGTLHLDDELQLIGGKHGGPVTVRGLQSQGAALERLGPVSRAAVNTRGVTTEQVGRGDVLITPGAFPLTEQIDVRRTSGEDLTGLPHEIQVHIGSASVPVHVRPFDAEHARLTLDRALPLRLGDRIVLRGTGEHLVLGGVQVMDVDPPELNRRGDGTRRSAQLEQLPDTGGDVSVEVARRRAVREDRLRRAGIVIPDPLPDGVERHGDLLVDAAALSAWTTQLTALVTAAEKKDALSAGVPRQAAVQQLALPDASLLDVLVSRATLKAADGRLRTPGGAGGLGAAEAGIAVLEERLRAQPFAAPEADDLAALRLGPKELAAAERLGRVLRLDDGVVLLPTAPALAMREIARLPQPFTLSQARQALGTTRRVAIPLLTHLDGRGWTRRVDGSLREVVR